MISATSASAPQDNLRPASEVMKLERLGSMFASRLSFVRSLMRKMIAESWQITNTVFDLDSKGHGLAIYRITTPGNYYECVIFSRDLEPEQRSDRVLAANSTGLGMAPFLINHPQLIQQWVYGRERALAFARAEPANEQTHKALRSLMARALKHLQQTITEDEEQTLRNRETAKSVIEVVEWLDRTPAHQGLYEELISWAGNHCSLEAQELINTMLIELYPELVEPIDDELGCQESMDLKPDMKASKLRDLIHEKFDWALSYREDCPDDNYWFWYRSVEKEEPRLGIRGTESGAEKELALAVGPRISRCLTKLDEFLVSNPNAIVVEFLLANPGQKECVRRIQTIGDTPYGEIRANLWHRDMKPMHLLRTKLSFFGASRFDPKSDRWVRITLFQGAPLPGELNDPRLPLHQLDDWGFPLEPGLESIDNDQKNRGGKL